MIKTLLENFGKVNLFTRPRRFGKTLNISMLKYFFETGSDSALFNGLEIAKEKELCDEYRGKFPMISISLKNASSDTFDGAKKLLRGIIGDEALRFAFFSESASLMETERRQFLKIVRYKEYFGFTDAEVKTMLEYYGMIGQYSVIKE